MAIARIGSTGDSKHSHDGGGRSPGHTTPGAGRFTVDADISALASIMGTLRQLRESSPEKFEQVMSRVARTLEADATGSEAGLLSELVANLRQAAESGGALPLRLADAVDQTGRHHHRAQSYAEQQPSSDAVWQDSLVHLARVIENAMREVGE